jgi:hypothetical protein
MSDHISAFLLFVVLMFLLGIGYVSLHAINTLRTELAQTREIAEAARINTHINADNLQTIKKHWGGPRHEQLEFMAEVWKGDQK